jgi:hypothetical protein
MAAYAYYYPIPPMRSELPTLPYDLSEYARIACGPDSVAARSDDPRDWSPEAPAIEIDPPISFVAGPLIEIRDHDVPRVVTPLIELDTLGPREQKVLSILDGRRTFGAILRAWTLPESELIDVLCELCSRGLVAIDPAR